MKKELDLRIFEELLSTLNLSNEYDGFGLDNLVYALCLEYCVSRLVDYELDADRIKEILKSFDYELLEHKEGEEGGGEYCHGVFKLKDKIYKATYSYYSYNGDEYSGIANTLKEVHPKEKTIIVYE